MTTSKHVPPDQAFQEQIESDFREFLRDVASTASRGDLFLSGRVRHPTLGRMVRIAVYDRWFEYSDEEIAEKLEVDGGELTRLRKHPEMQAVHHEIEDAFQVVAVPQRLREHLAGRETEHELFRHNIRLVRQVNDPKAAQKALADLQERIMPTKRVDTEGGGGARVLVNIEHFALIQAGQEALRRAGLETGPELPEIIDLGEDEDE